MTDQNQNQYQAPSSNVEQSAIIEYGSVKFLSFSGRLGRIRYLAYSIGVGLLFWLLIALASGLFVGIGMSSGDGMNAGVGIVVMLAAIAAYIVFFVFLFMLTIQRAHDFNVSGWLSLIIFIPLGSLVFVFVPGTNGENQYGLKTPPNGAATIVVIVMALLIPVMGILAAIAIPAYTDYVEKASQIQLDQSR